MFYIEAHEEGFLVRWDAGDAIQADALGAEIFFSGLRRTRETLQSFVVPRYRNELETLRVLSDLCSDLGIMVTLDEDLVESQTAGEAEQYLLASLRGQEMPVEPVPATLPEFASGRCLLGYQQIAVAKHLRVVHSADFSVPGSGKTAVALATWAHTKRTKPDLGLWVIGPLSCFQPWEEEFSACFGRVPISLRLQGSAAQRTWLLRHTADHELVLTNYHTAWRETEAIAAALSARPWMLVLDEAHYVKSMSGMLASTVRRLAPSAVRRLALTGTPMPRSPEDLWSIFTFLWPSEALLGNAAQHVQRCKRPVQEVCEELRTDLAPMFHRTTKASLGLPPVEQTYPVVTAESLPKTQRLLIRLIERRTLTEDEYLATRDQGHVRRWRRARLIRLMQVTSNPLLLAEALSEEEIDEYDESSTAMPDDIIIPLSTADSDLARALSRYRELREISGKVRYVADRCRELVASGEKVVIWTVFLGNVALLEQVLADLRPLVITGSVPSYEAEEDEEGEQTREQRIRIFKTDPNRRVLIANAAACAESVSLHKVCQHAIYLERSFNAAHFIQSMDRIHRQGMLPGKTAHIEIPSVPCAIERVLNRRLLARQEALYRLLDDPMPIVGFDDEAHQGYFDVEDVEEIGVLFAEVLAEIRAEPQDETAW
jgi:hypothetical protein